VAAALAGMCAGGINWWMAMNSSAATSANIQRAVTAGPVIEDGFSAILSSLRACAKINWHFGASAGWADAKRRDVGDVDAHRRGAATKQMPTRRRAPSGCGPQALRIVMLIRRSHEVGKIAHARFHAAGFQGTPGSGLWIRFFPQVLPLVTAFASPVSQVWTC